MVNLQAVQAHNATLKSLTSDLVAVFGTFNLSNILARYHRANGYKIPSLQTHTTD